METGESVREQFLRRERERNAGSRGGTVDDGPPSEVAAAAARRASRLTAGSETPRQQDAGQVSGQMSGRRRRAGGGGGDVDAAIRGLAPPRFGGRGGGGGGGGDGGSELMPNADAAAGGGKEAEGTPIPFDVAWASSDDGVHVARELEVAPSRGESRAKHRWASAPRCRYPQELVLRLPRQHRLSSVRLLAHEYKTPARVELLVSQSGVVDHAQPLAKVKRAGGYERLGRVRFANNAANNFKVREQKRVTVNADARYLRLLVHAPHENATLNADRQVSLLGVQLFGLPVTTGHLTGLSEGDRALLELGVPLDVVAAPPEEPPAPRIDPDTKLLLSQLEDMKNAARDREDYDKASALKRSIDQLEAVGERIFEAQRDKRQAIADEDYAMAAAIKDQLFAMGLQRDNILRPHMPEKFGARVRTAASAAASDRPISARDGDSPFAASPATAAAAAAAAADAEPGAPDDYMQMPLLTAMHKRGVGRHGGRRRRGARRSRRLHADAAADGDAQARRRQAPARPAGAAAGRGEEAALARVWRVAAAALFAKDWNIRAVCVRCVEEQVLRVPYYRQHFVRYFKILNALLVVALADRHPSVFTKAVHLLVSVYDCWADSDMVVAARGGAALSDAGSIAERAVGTPASRGSRRSIMSGSAGGGSVVSAADELVAISVPDNPRSNEPAVTPPGDVLFGAHRIKKADVRRGLSNVMPLLLHRAADSNTSVRRAASDALIMLARMQSGVGIRVLLSVLFPDVAAAALGDLASVGSLMAMNRAAMKFKRPVSARSRVAAARSRSRNSGVGGGVGG
eukprot:CAMPEP_0203833608 /NCGR_PEP_ID=MMETSP0115-20131106/72742_1 /ASSEMBLY_ACC=CAM_ASM_000227 /TAXON_ID=33651 /ORGANISM="Bicosoecid sp, Strain ms1" /LENGTH=801 /DNA_ID=CAMNT_0050742679 /DNA_START=62 /DNA_END=2465 /DNA_ORIENTATION=+